MEGCKIWGNASAGVVVEDSGSQAVVKGCECVNAWELSRDPLLVLLGIRLHLRSVGKTLPLNASLYFSHRFSTSLGRIYDGKNSGVFFVQCGKGRVEGCQISGHEGAGVLVQGSGSEAVVVGCKCAGGRAGLFVGGSIVSDSASP